MEEAYLVIPKTDERKLVKADEVEYSDYSRIFLCPRCNQVLTLRKGSFRDDSWVKPAFIHPKGNLDDCPLRATPSTSRSPSKDEIWKQIQRGQSSRKLERAFLDLFYTYKIDSKPSITDEYFPGYRSANFPAKHKSYKRDLQERIKNNLKPGNICLEPNLFINSAFSILRQKQSRMYFQNLIEEFRLSLISNASVRKYFHDREKEGRVNWKTLDVEERLSEEESIGHHCILLERVHSFLSQAASEDFLRNLLNLIFLSHSTTSLKDGKLVTKFEIIQLFDVEVLSPIYKSEYFRERCFTEFYQDSNKRRRRNKRTKFIKFVLQEIFESYSYFDWIFLPDYYR